MSLTEALGKPKWIKYYTLIMMLKDQEENGEKTGGRGEKTEKLSGLHFGEQGGHRKINRDNGDNGILEQGDFLDGVCPACGGYICAHCLGMALLPHPAGPGPGRNHGTT